MPDSGGENDRKQSGKSDQGAGPMKKRVRKTPVVSESELYAGFATAIIKGDAKNAEHFMRLMQDLRDDESPDRRDNPSS